jgi:hypothetical protein
VWLAAVVRSAGAISQAEWDSDSERERERERERGRQPPLLLAAAAAWLPAFSTSQQNPDVYGAAATDTAAEIVRRELTLGRLGRDDGAGAAGAGRFSISSYCCRVALSSTEEDEDEYASLSSSSPVSLAGEACLVSRLGAVSLTWTLCPVVGLVGWDVDSRLASRLSSAEGVPLHGVGGDVVMDWRWGLLQSRLSN